MSESELIQMEKSEFDKVKEYVEFLKQQNAELIRKNQETAKAETPKVQISELNKELKFEAKQRELASVVEKAAANKVICDWALSHNGYFEMNSISIYSRKSHSGKVKFSVKSITGKLYRKCVDLGTGKIYASKGN